ATVCQCLFRRVLLWLARLSAVARLRGDQGLGAAGDAFTRQEHRVSWLSAAHARCVFDVLYSRTPAVDLDQSGSRRQDAGHDGDEFATSDTGFRKGIRNARAAACATGPRLTAAA